MTIDAWQKSLQAANLLKTPPQTLWTHPLLTIQEVTLHTPHGPLKRLVIHRGTFTAVCVHLVGSTREAFLMVRQQRPVRPEPFYEHPAGMIEPGEDPRIAIARELAEETGLLITPDDLLPLSPQPVYPSPGLWHEKGYFFALRLQVPDALIEAFSQPHLRQNPDEPLHLIALPPHQVLTHTANLQTLAHTLLYLYAQTHPSYGNPPSTSP